MISHLQDETCDRVIENFSLLPLYSEANPVVSFLVHRGANMTGQLLKMVVSVVLCFMHSYRIVGKFGGQQIWQIPQFNIWRVLHFANCPKL